MKSKSANIDRRKPSGEPQFIDDNIWYYESKTGIEIVAENRDENDMLLHVSHVKIPWSMLKTSMKRCC